MYGQAYFDKGGDTITCQTRNGWVPGYSLGVVFVANSESMGAPRPMTMTLAMLRSYVLGLFMNEPLPELNKSFQDTLDMMNGAAADTPTSCDPFLFLGASPGDRAGTTQQPASEADVKDIVGTYAAPFYGRVAVAWHENQLMMRYGQQSGRLYFTQDHGVFAWDAPSLLVEGPVVLSTQGDRWVLVLEGAEFVKELRDVLPIN